MKKVKWGLKYVIVFVPKRFICLIKMGGFSKILDVFHIFEKWVFPIEKFSLRSLLSKKNAKGLVDFQSIRANWNKKFSVIATEKPSLPPNRVFSGPTFDFRWPTHICYLEGDFGSFLKDILILLNNQNLKLHLCLVKK